MYKLQVQKVKLKSSTDREYGLTDQDAICKILYKAQ